jgi:hypothetical protein
MLMSPHEMSQNHPIGIDEVKGQDKSSQPAQFRGGLLRAAASYNQALKLVNGDEPCWQLLTLSAV